MKESQYNVWVAQDGDHYVFNGTSGALMRVSPAERALLQEVVSPGQPAGGGDPPEHAEFLGAARRARVVLADEADELGALEARYRTAAGDTTHLGLTLVPSLGCNFDCPYCFEAKHPSLMDAEVEQAILRLLTDRAPGLRSLGVCWFGGEPLVGRDALFRLSERFIGICDAEGIDYGARIVTNGWLLDEPTARRLRENRVTLAQVTLDGPPDVHDRMRPTAGGRGTFARIVQNLHSAVDHLDVAIRINVDTQNLHRVEELLDILRDEGLAERLSVSLGQLVGIDDDPAAPSASYQPRCLSNREFAQARLWLEDAKTAHGFRRSASLPTPLNIPCTAVTRSELVIGSRGEMYKCYENIGNSAEVIGNIRDYLQVNGRLEKWLKYDPFANDECRSCIALPVCMGGCAHHAFDERLYPNRCGQFRHTYREQVQRYVAVATDQPVPRAPAPADFLGSAPAGRRLIPLQPV